MTDPVVDSDDLLRLVAEQATALLAAHSRPESLRARLGAGDPAREFDAGLWRAMVEAGWPAMLAPEPAGLGLDLAILAPICEQAGRAVAASPLIATALLARLETAAAAGDDRHACIVADDRAPLRLAAGHLHGQVSAVPFGASATTALVLTCDDDGEPAVAACDLAQSAVSRVAVRTVDAHATADLAFDAVPARLLARGAAACDALLGDAALLTAWEQIGGADVCLALARDYASDRIAFGQPIGRFQAIKHALADVYAAIEIARGAALAAAAAMRVEAANRHAAQAAARWAASTAYEQAATVCVHVHGGIGVTWEALPQLHYRRARALAVQLGPPSIWRDRVMTAIEAIGTREALAIHD